MTSHLRSQEPRNRYRQKRSGTWAPLTPAEPAREHLDHLRACGMTLEQISVAADVSVTTLTRAAKAPRISTAAADALLTVQPTEADPAATATEALRSLVADGWTLEQLAPATGLTTRTLNRIISDQTTPHRSTTQAIAHVYEHLRWEDPGDGTAALRSQLRAERAGWQPSTQWKGLDDVDIVAVDRAVRGETLPLRPAGGPPAPGRPPAGRADRPAAGAQHSHDQTPPHHSGPA